MLEALDAETLATWQAVATIDGWGEDNERAARICAEFHNSLMVVEAAKTGATLKPEDFKTGDDFIPKFKFESKVKATPTQTPEQMNEIGKRMAGIQ